MVQFQSLAASTPQHRKRAGIAGWVGLSVLLIGIGVALFLRGQEYYLLSPEERVDHEDYALLAPGHLVGHGYGIVGSALILTNLLYLARRRLVRWALGSMNGWLNLHVATGLVGGLLIVFHSTFQMRNAMTTASMWAMVIVLVTGLIGRFIFALVPKPDFSRLRQNCEVLDAIVPGLGPWFMNELASCPVPSIEGRVTPLKVMRMLPVWRGEAQRRRRLVFETVASYDTTLGSEFSLVGACVAETASIAFSIPRAVAMDSVMRSWRGLHRFFALLMVLLVAVHVGVAWYYGYRWILSEPTAGGL